MDRKEAFRVIDKYTQIEKKRKKLAQKIKSHKNEEPENDPHKLLMRKFGIVDKEAEEKKSFNFGRYISALVGKFPPQTGL